MHQELLVQLMNYIMIFERTIRVVLLIVLVITVLSVELLDQPVFAVFVMQDMLIWIWFQMNLLYNKVGHFLSTLIILSCNGARSGGPPWGRSGDAEALSTVFFAFVPRFCGGPCLKSSSMGHLVKLGGGGCPPAISPRSAA